MSSQLYIKCPYCSKTVIYGDEHLENCCTNYIDETLLFCYSCGKNNNKFSNSQLEKKRDKARCIECVKNNTVTKFEPFDYLFRDKCSEKNTEHFDSQLMNAISKLDLEKVNELLLLNANVNYVSQESFYCPIEFSYLLSYNDDGSEKKDLDITSASTPLKLCVFKFSDIVLSEHDKLKIIDIATQLIKFGASVTEATEYFVSRYGISSDKDLYQLFYELLTK